MAPAGDAGSARFSGGLLLAIDTSDERCSACVFEVGAGRILSQAEPEIGRGHAERLMDVIAGCLQEAGAKYRDIARVAVCVGPGSFTGIRVGVSAARGLSLALGCPAVGIDSLEAIAEPHLGQGAAVLSVQNARRGELFVALYAPDGDCPHSPAALAPEALAGFVRPQQPALLLAGSGAAIAAEQLSGSRVVEAAGTVPIAAVARIGARRLPGLAPKPLYLRSADARPQAPSGLRDAGFQPASSLR